jgi:hypothetical protein
LNLVSIGEFRLAWQQLLRRAFIRGGK